MWCSQDLHPWHGDLQMGEIPQMQRYYLRSRGSSPTWACPPWGPAPGRRALIMFGFENQQGLTLRDP